MNVLISFVSENEDLWFERVENLVMSIREFGGTLRDANIVANFVGGIAPRFEERLESFKVTTRVVEPYRPDNPYSNKLRMLELAREIDFDILLMLDCDVIVSGDVTTSLDLDHIGACLDWSDPLSEDQWQFLFQQFGLSGMERNLEHPLHESKVYPYFNTGVVSVPHRLCLPLLDAWSVSLDVMARVFDQRSDIREHSRNHNQFAFCGALLSTGLPSANLPINLNFFTGRSETKDLGQLHPPFIIHYRSNIDRRGSIRASEHDAVNSHIDLFNRHRAQRLDLKYRGLQRKSLPRRMSERSPIIRRVVVAILRLRNRLIRLLGREPRRISHI